MTGPTNPLPAVGDPRAVMHDIVVVGASAGGVEALRRFIGALDAEFTGSMFVVLHLPTNAHSSLPDILQRAGNVVVTHAADGAAPEAGQVYVAPPDVHLLLRPGAMRLVRGPTENGHRPAIDPLFRSAADAYGSRVVGVVLSGVLDDGTNGLLAVARRGGITAVQAPEDALYAAMPQNALDSVPVDVVAPARELGATIQRLLAQERPPHPPPDGELVDQVEAALEPGALEMRGRPSRFTCPDCGGSLWDVGDEEPSKFRCRVGHSWTTLGLLERQAETLESALWTALRALAERADLARRMRDDAARRGHRHGERLFERQLEEHDGKAEVLREALATPEPMALVSEEQPAGLLKASEVAGADSPAGEAARP